jgi:UDP-N-acetylglucosamine 2-epimerase (non-hydrolysing)
MPRIDSSDVVSRLGLSPRGYFLVSAHREENVDSPEVLADLMDALNGLVEQHDLPVIFSTHPRTRKQLKRLDHGSFSSRIQFSEPFGYFDFVQLQKNALCVLSDSGTITEEASLLDLAAVTIRNAHERPEGMDAGTLVMCGVKRQGVLDAVRVVTRQRAAVPRPANPVPDYGNPAVSHQVVRIVLSYVDYVNRTVWSR